MDVLATAIVLSYNQGRYVEQTLDSIKKQTHKELQVIIVDDCSTDDSVAVVEKWLSNNQMEATFLRHSKNQGVCAAINSALAISEGEYISIIAGDDVWFPDKFSRQIAIMESQPKTVGLVYSNCYVMDEHGNFATELHLKTKPAGARLPEGKVFDILIQSNFIACMTALVRRGCYDKVGLYDTSLYFEDWDMWLRIAQHYEFVYSEFPSAIYRINPRGMTRSGKEKMRESSERILAKYQGATLCQ